MPTASNARVRLFARDAPSVILEPFAIHAGLNTLESTVKFAKQVFTVIVMVFAQLAQSSAHTVRLVKTLSFVQFVQQVTLVMLA